MAKGKHSTALFEVIHSANKPDRVAQSLRTPKWWFKSRPKSQTATSQSASQSASQSDTSYSEPEYSEPQAVEDTQRGSAEDAPVRSRFPRLSRRGRSSEVSVGFDRGRQEVTFKLRYTTALVTAFGVFVLVGLSYVIGRHLGGPKTASAEQASVKELLQQPAQPDVIKVTKPKPTQVQPPRAANPEKSQSPALANSVVAPKQNVLSSSVPATADTTMPRKVGLNYLVLHAYTSDRLTNAQAARDFFTKNGIPCTLEKTGWTLGNNWYTLIGTAGFSRVSTDDFKSYVKAAAAIADTAKTANFDRPQPTTMTVYKWKVTDGAQPTTN